MSQFTRIGGGLWDWEPWVNLELADARLLWLALYTTPAARRICPGLWHGGPLAMAEAARMGQSAVLSALDVLLDHELVEYDPRHRVLRLCELPDAGEYPDNGNILKGWWSRFKTVPACPIRDAHVRTIRWIMEQGATDKGRALSHHHHEAWAETFGTVTIPVPRRRGAKRVADSDTSTAAQPGLFGQPIPPVQAPPSEVSPQVYAQAVDNSAVLRQSKEIRGPETVSKRLGEGEREGEGEILISTEPIRDDLRSRSRTAPMLTLVPPYTVAEAIAVFREAGRYDAMFDATHQEALSEAHARWVAARVGLEDLRVLAQYLRGPTNARHLSSENVPAVVARARAQLEQLPARLAMLREFVP
jgi:hypothetical protein